MIQPPLSTNTVTVLQSVEDQRHLRALVAASDGIAFVADGSVLPRRGGSDDRPMEAARGAVPFKSPESLRKEFRLPNRGVVEGMLVPRGVTVIVGGGYHGQFSSEGRGVCCVPLFYAFLCRCFQSVATPWICLASGRKVFPPVLRWKPRVAS